MANQATITEQSQPQVDVLLTWSDFLHSLETLKNKPYSAKCHQRDWFRLNPLDIVLLGSKTIKSKMPARRKISHTFVGIEDISLQIMLKPRILKHVILSLHKVLIYSDAASPVVQQCCTALADIYEASLRCPKLKGICAHWYFVAIFPTMIQLIDSEHVTENPTTRVKVKWLIDHMQKLQNQSSIEHLAVDCENCPVESVLKIMLGNFDEIPSSVAYQVVLLQEYIQNSNTCAKFIELLDNEESFSNILSHLKHGEIEYDNGVLILLSILQVVLSGLVFYEDVSYSEDVDLTKDETTSETSTSIDVNEIITLFSSLLEQIEKHINKWASINSGKSSVSSKILELVFVSLSSQSLDRGLRSTLEFFGDPLSLLMIYANEGYLTQDAAPLFIQLLDFICCAIEVNLSLREVVTNFIPNLFGPVFGVHDGRVLCKVLEFGTLALKSRHRKKLLWEGIMCIIKVYKSFQPIEVERSKEQYLTRKVEAVKIALHILDDIIDRSTVLAFSTVDNVPNNEDNIDDFEHPCCGEGSTAPSELPLCTAEEVINDKKNRLEILFYLFELANALAASGNDIFYIFASVLPRVFLPVSLLQRVGDENVARIIGHGDKPGVEGFIPWDVDRRSFAVVLLALCAAAEHNGACSAFQLCAVVLPKLVKNLDVADLDGNKKIQAMTDIYQLIHDTLRAGYDINVLVSHGIPLMSQLLPVSSSADEMRIFMEQMAKQLTKASFSSVLLLVSNACDFMITNFPQETLNIQQLFLHLLKRGKRDDIRNIARLCNKTMCEPRLGFVRTYLYSHAAGELTSRQLAELSEILVAINGLSSKNRLSVHEENDVTDEDLARKRIIDALTDVIVKNLKIILEKNAFDKTTWSELHDCITKVSVCIPLLTNDELALENSEELFDLDVFMHRKFPSDILQDSELMTEIGTISRRIQVMQTPRYDALKELVVRSLNVFLMSNCSESADTKEGDEQEITNRSPVKAENVLEERLQDDQIPPEFREGDDLNRSTRGQSSTVISNEFQVNGTVESGHFEEKTRENILAEYLFGLPRNTEVRERLTKFGYSPQLWEEKPTVHVTTNGTRCVEENLRDNLAACFTGYQNLLRELGIPRVDVDGTMVEVDDLFDPTISSVAELKGRRAIATRLIDKHISKQNDMNLLDSKNGLLAMEDAIEEKFEDEACKPCKPITFTASLSTSFFDCAKCCGSKIVGCYAPSGVHCERPLEIGIRVDSGFASIFDETGTEIENCELLFTDQGVYVFRAYTNSHPYDTSQVWIKLFTVLLSGSSSYVPAVIVPYLHPNVTTWNSLRRQIPAELTGSVLSCDFDFSVEWQTYYDYKPERVRGGKDIVLKRGFDISQSEKTSAFLNRQLSLENKDLGGLIFEHVMNRLCTDGFLKRFRFLGTHLSLFINNFLENGHETSSFLSERFDYERWLVKSKQTSSDAPSKDEIINNLANLVQQSISSFCTEVDLEEMFTNKRHQFFQLKAFFLAKKRLGDKFAKKSVCEINKILRTNCEVALIQELEESLQEEIIHWVFRNEDRVWRYRGGRDGHETLEQFMNFLGREEKANEKCFPGVVVFIRSRSKNQSSTARPFEVRDIVAYAVGEYGRKEEERDDEHEDEQEDDHEEEQEDEQLSAIKHQAYEVVTAWVHPRFRRLNLGIEMYMEICRNVRSPFMICDILENSLNNIIQSSSMFARLDRVGVLSWFIGYRRRSYQVITQSGEEEQFEKVAIRRNFLRVVITLHDLYMFTNRRVSRTTFLIGLTTSVCAMIASYYYFK